jgi:hypothetical protein
MAPKAPGRHAPAVTPRRSRFATQTGLVLGSALAALAMWDGARLRIGSGLPGWLSTFLGGVVVWLIVVTATAVIAEVLRRNRQAISRSAGRQARRAGGRARRSAGRARRAALRRGETWAGRRWHARTAPGTAGPATGDGTAPGTGPAGTAVPAAGGGDGAALPRPPGRAYPAHPVHGKGPWMVRFRSRSGRLINRLGNGGRGSSEGVVGVYDPADLTRRLAAAASDPDIQYQVRTMPGPDDTDPGWPAWQDGPAPGSSPGTPEPRGALDPALEQAIKEQVCTWGAADGLEPDEVTVGADGSITIDRRHKIPWATQAITGTLRWEPAEGGGARVVDLYPTSRYPAVVGPAKGHPAGGDTTRTGGTDMTDRSAAGSPATWSAVASQQAEHQARRGRRRPAGDITVTWKELVGATSDFEPEDDAHLMAWMAGEAAGQASYAEAITDVYETAVNTVGLDPVAMQALHEYAEAAADAAKAMADARARFAAHYQAVREFTAAGGVMPHNGRWITGEGE